MTDEHGAFGSPASLAGFFRGSGLSMFGRKKLDATLDGLEIGATGPNRLQFVLAAQGRKVTVKLSAEEARWLAYALRHWADSSETIPPVKLVEP